MAAIDTAHLAAYTSFPEANIQSLIESPTTALVHSFLTALSSVAQYHETLKSENLRLSVEHESAVRDAEAKSRALKSNSQQLKHELDGLRVSLEAEKKSSADLESRLQSLQTSSSTSSSEVEALQTRVKSLEKSNRDTLALLEAKSTAYDNLSEDLAAQHQKTIIVRREVSSLQERLTAAENNVSNAKFKESALQQEIELLKRNNDWLDGELKTKAAEYTKYRKEKTARIAELQRENEDGHTTVESLRKTETSLRKRLDETASKADAAFSTIQRLQEDASRQEESFRAELESTRRLANLQEQSATTAKKRVAELDSMIDSIKQDAADELSNTQSELETERESKVELETRVEELELQLENAQAASLNRVAQQGEPSTPRPGRSALGTPTRALSPATFTPSTARSRGAMTRTELFDAYSRTRSELAEEKVRNENLAKTVDEILRDLEQKGPELEEREGEVLHLNSEVDRLSSALVKSGAERDAARKDSRKFEGQVDRLTREADLLRQQLRDLSTQIKILLAEMQVRSDGTELTADERLQLQQAAHAEGQSALESMTDTGQFISKHLVAFKNIFELQETNTKLLHLTRTLGEQMEGDEARAKQNQRERDHQELIELRDRIAALQDELKSLTTQSNSYIQERDMFRRMLSNRVQLPQDTEVQSMFGQSLNGFGSPAPSQTGDVTGEFSATSKQLSEHIKLLRDMQSHFDAYKEEAATDHQTLRKQADQLAKEKADLQGEIARTNSQLTLAHERLSMLQGNFNYLKSESEESQKRVQSLGESAARQDLRTQQVAEELVDAKAIADSMRNENANLKAERELWKRIESRLTEDNRALVDERGRLNKSITDNQSLANERELADSETRRRLENQIQSLETDLRNTQRKFEEAVEEKKKDDLRREYESDQNRTRIDDLVMSLANVKEELSGTKTARDQLQSRVDEIKIDLRNAEERAQALQPRPTARSNAQESIAQPDEDTLTREQELAVEVADLKRELDLTKGELENVRAQVEQYKNISQSSEEELQSLTETQQQYRTEMDALLEQKNSKVQELDQRIQEITSELSENTRQLSELIVANEEHSSRMEQQRIIFESELARAKDDSERHLATARFHQEDLRAQAEIARQAQQAYESELVKHAEAAKSLQKTRNDYNEIKLEVSQAKADAEAARAMLSQNEESWSASKDRYEKEINEMKQRREDVDKQNRVLHQQLDNVSTQIASLQQQRAAGNNDETSTSMDDSAQNLQEVIRYLRREKEIVDVQYELSVQEARRLKQQLDYSQSQLDEARSRLEQERRQQTDEERGSMSHSKIMEKLQELNVYRESSVTLRNEARQAQLALSEKTKQVADLVAQIEPLQTDLRTKQNELETAQGEVTLAKEDRDRWQSRMQNILQKYDRVDPAEMEGLKNQIAQLQQERDNAATEKQVTEDEKQTLQVRINGIPDEIKQATDAAEVQFNSWKQRVTEQFKERNKQQNERNKTLQTDVQTARSQLETAQTELAATRAARDDALQQVQALQEAATQNSASLPNPPDTNMQEGNEEGEVAESAPMVPSADTSAGPSAGEAELQAALNANQTQLTEQTARAESLQQRVQELEQDVTRLTAEVQARSSDEHLEKLRQDLQNAQTELEALRNAPTTSQSAATSSTSPTTEVATDQGNEKPEANEEQYQQRIQQAEEQFKQRGDAMRKQLSAKLQESRQEIRAEAAKERDEALEKARMEHERTVQNIKDEHATSLAQLKSEYETEISKAQNTGVSASEPAEQTAPRSSEPPADTANTGSAEDVTTTEVKTEPSDFSPPTGWEPPVQLMREWINKIPAIKDLLKKNIEKKSAQAVEEAKKELSTELEKIKGEQANVLNEQRDKLTKQKDQAVMLETKKQAAKLSAADGRARTAQAKVDVVQKAATDTPERPVAEVWAIAKDAKPVAAASSQQANTSGVSTPPRPSTISAQAPQQATKPASQQLSQPTSQPTGQPASQTASQPSVSVSAPSPSKPDAAAAAAAATAPAAAFQEATQPNTEIAQADEQPAGPASEAGNAPPVPRNVANQGSGIPRGNAGVSIRGGAAGRGGLPIPSGSGIPRGGRGGAAGRGGAQRGNYNPGASTFVPGNKRPRESSVGPGNVDNGGKRQRGGGPSA